MTSVVAATDVAPLFAAVFGVAIGAAASIGTTLVVETGKTRARREERGRELRIQRDEFLRATLQGINEVLDEVYPLVFGRLSYELASFAGGHPIEVGPEDRPPAAQFEIFQMLSTLRSLTARLPGSAIKDACIAVWEPMSESLFVGSEEEAKRVEATILTMLPLAQEMINGGIGQLYGRGPQLSDYEDIDAV